MAQLRDVREATGKALAHRFRVWGLTPSEREVATLLLKGHDVAEIAELRGTALSTVRVQLATIYHKAGVNYRSAFVSLLIEDVIGGADLEPRS